MVLLLLVMVAAISELQRRLQRPQAAESSPAPASGEVAKRPSER
ncbi:hypothetical protein AK812_SmicGene46175, partial [Symbiodinium microadriaticum]